ncbi:MAG: hypothetical protein ACRBB0_11385 [Pelagimonas sp.]|uniref:hypothetical protein n=1 Tax=Pelagimonas sp. TaxID=2073170 RepID=UPI003D6BC6BF
MAGIFLSARNLITTTIDTTSNVVSATGALIRTATDGVDTLDHAAQAYYSSIKAGAFERKACAEKEAILSEVRRHVNVMAELEQDMRRHPDIYKEFETLSEASMKRWEGKQGQRETDD